MPFSGYNQIKMDPQKSVFGAVSVKFFGFLVTKRRVEANLEKIWVVLDMRPPATVKDVQKLAGQVASLGRFVPKSTTSVPSYSRFFEARVSLSGRTSARRLSKT